MGSDNRLWKNGIENEMSRVNKEVENIKNKQDTITVELSGLKGKVNNDRSQLRGNLAG
jgi:archaellum component FlaC